MHAEALTADLGGRQAAAMNQAAHVALGDLERRRDVGGRQRVQRGPGAELAEIEPGAFAGHGLALRTGLLVRRAVLVVAPHERPVQEARDRGGGGNVRVAGGRVGAGAGGVPTGPR
jgi:hypothetical protein